MARTLLGRALAILLIAVFSSGCVAKPPERPTVLRQPTTERRLAHHVPPHNSAHAGDADWDSLPIPPKPPHRHPHHPAMVAVASSTTATVTKPAPEPAPPPPAILTPDQKDSLFRQFDDYLTQSEPAQ